MAHLLHIKASVVSTPDTDTLETLLQLEDGYVWLDLSGEDGEGPAGGVAELLSARFGFHPVVIEDALQETHIPKLNEWFDYIYLVLAGLQKEDDGYTFPEVDIFLGQRYLVTYHHETPETFSRLRERALSDASFRERGPDYLLYRLMGLLAEDFLQMAEDLHMQSLDLENELLADADTELLARILDLRRAVRQLQFYIEPQRSVLRQLSHLNHAALDQDKTHYRFSDVTDHYNRIFGMLIVLSENLSSAMEMYLSLASNRMNAVVKILTVITTLVLPLTLLTSFFGMNFFPVGREFAVWTSQPVFRVFVALMIALPLMMVWWMRRNKWL
jgi:magnesium transporter